MNPETTGDTLDLVIVGGGPAGMSAALVAGRARLTTAVINDEEPRNAVTRASHGFLTRDGAHPSELLEVAKEQLDKYGTVRYVNGTALDARKVETGFEVGLADGARLVSERVIIATGQRDDLTQLRLPGIEDVYGKSVFPCPFCDGYEHRDARLALFGGAGIEHFAPVVSIWSKDIVVFTNGTRLDDGPVATLERNAVRVVQEPVARLISDDGILRAVELEAGDLIEREAGFIAEEFSVPATNLAEGLGVGRVRNDFGMEVLDVDDAGKSKVTGVYAIGDSKAGFAGLIAAASDGSTCAEMIVHELATERWQRSNGLDAGRSV